MPGNFNRCVGPSEQLREKILDETENLYSKARWFARTLPTTFEECVELGEELIQQVNKDASPGFHWVWAGVSTNADVLRDDSVRKEVCIAFANLMWKILKSEEMPLPVVRLFIKNEPHKLQKLKDGKYRLIWAYPLEYQMVHRFFLSASINAELDSCDDIPSKPGTSFVQGGTRKLYSYMYNGGKNLGEADKSGWDISVPACLQEMERDARWRLCLNPDVVGFKFGFFDCYRTLMLSRVVFSDGTILEQMEPGIVRSGGLITISGNSRMQVLLKVWYCSERGQFDDNLHRLMAMGDDTVERIDEIDTKDYVAWMQNKGIKVKHFNVGPLIGTAFCSHEFRVWRDQIVPVPTNWFKHQFSLAIKPRAKHKFYGMQLFSLMMEYAFVDEVFQQLRSEVARVEPRFAVSQRQLQNFVLGYENLVPRLSLAERRHALANDEFSFLCGCYGLTFQGPVRVEPRRTLFFELWAAWFMLGAVIIGCLPDCSVLPEQRMLDYQGSSREPPAFFKHTVFPVVKALTRVGERWGGRELAHFSDPKHISNMNKKKISGTDKVLVSRKQMNQTIAKKVAAQVAKRKDSAGQPMKAVAALAPNFRPGKQRKAFIKANRFGMDSATLQGRDLIQKIVLSANSASQSSGKDIAGTLLYATAIRPQQMIPNTRLSRMVGLFQKYRIRSMKFIFESALPSGLNAGSMLFVHEPDPNEALPAQYAAPTAGTLANYDSHSATQVVPMAQIPKGFQGAPGQAVRTDLNLGMYGGWFLVDPQNKATPVENTAGQFAIFVQDVHNCIGSSGFLPTNQYEIGSLFCEYTIDLQVASDAADTAGGYTSLVTSLASGTGVAYVNPSNTATQTFSPTGGLVPIAAGAASVNNTWKFRELASSGLKVNYQFDGTREWWGFPESGVYFVMENLTTPPAGSDLGSTQSGWSGWTHKTVTGSSGSVLHAHSTLVNSTTSPTNNDSAVAFGILDVEDPLLDFFSPGTWSVGTGGSATNTAGTMNQAVEFRAVALPPESTLLLRRGLKSEKERGALLDELIARLSVRAPTTEEKEEKKEAVSAFSGEEVASAEAQAEQKLLEASARWLKIRSQPQRGLTSKDGG